MKQEGYEWRQFECEHCGLRFMIHPDVLHKTLITYCPECMNKVK